MYKAILFDAEGVVVDTEKLWDLEQLIFLEGKGVKYDRDKIKHLMTGKSLTEATKRMKEIYHLEGELGKMVHQRVTFLKDLFEKKVSFVNNFERFYEKVKNKYKTCISTSMDNQLFELISKKLSLKKLFGNNLFTIKNVGMKSKPDPAIFLYSARMLELEPSECMVIEDSPHGIKAAKSAGMYCIGITTTYKKDKLFEADQIVDNFEEIKIP